MKSVWAYANMPRSFPKYPSPCLISLFWISPSTRAYFDFRLCIGDEAQVRLCFIEALMLSSLVLRFWSYELMNRVWLPTRFMIEYWYSRLASWMSNDTFTIRSINSWIPCKRESTIVTRIRGPTNWYISDWQIEAHYQPDKLRHEIFH